MKRRSSVVLGFLLGAVLAVAAHASAQRVREEFHQTYPLAANGSIALKNISGSVHITTWAQNSVKVDAVKSARSEQALKDAQIAVDAGPDRIDIRTKYPDRDWDDDDGDSLASVEYTITVPAGTSLDKIGLVSGDLDITGVQGTVRASLVSGNVNARGLGGRADISSVSGNVYVTFDRATASADLHSVSGDVTAILPGNAGADVRANTVSGNISNEFGLSVDHGQWVGSHLSGKIGSGDKSIQLHTVSGDINLRRASL